MRSVTGWPGRMASSWVSLKFAVTQISSGTNIVRSVPACANWPTRGGEVDDAPRLGRRDGRVGEVELRLVALRLRLREIRLGAARCAFSASICRCGDLQRGLRAS